MGEEAVDLVAQPFDCSASAPAMPNTDAEADAAADPLHQQRRGKHPDHHAERLVLKPSGEDSCCLVLRRRHNSLAGVDGLIKLRKLAIDGQAEGAGLKSCGLRRRGQR
jgi:hypothetical protein